MKIAYSQIIGFDYLLYIDTDAQISCINVFNSVFIYNINLAIILGENILNFINNSIQFHNLQLSFISLTESQIFMRNCSIYSLFSNEILPFFSIESLLISKVSDIFHDYPFSINITLIKYF